ncbi:MAG TPA: hypothetical protein VMC84_04515 [Methanocella sp.]|uniref:hypothetical protein n=1 Tax=Methanocella sp. TaxID=2052833 RepID=UPI002C34755E|nr:hypothetical protein [Methanocella sp.]HTY90419.1 hypothetical protein [Methanocella sp.]
MLPSIDAALLGSLKKGLEGIVPGESVIMGIPEAGKKIRVYLHNDDFYVEEAAMGSMAETKYEEAQDTFDGDGKAKDFKLSKAPINELLLVEYPKGTVRFSPDDYAIDKAAGVLAFRDAPAKGKGNILARYSTPNPVGEVSYLRFVMTYAVTIVSDDDAERDRATLRAIETLYRDLAGLSRQGVADIRLVKGQSAFLGDDRSARANVLIYSVVSSMKVERVIPPMARVDIKSKSIKK